MKSFFELREAVKSADRKPETYTGPDGKPKVRMVPVDKEVVKEKTLTAAEKKKREEIAKAIQRDNPDMPMDKKMAIATAQAKKVAEEAAMREAKVDPKAVMQAVQAVKTFNAAHKKAMELYDRGKEKQADRYADMADKASKQFFAIVDKGREVKTPKVDQDLNLYGWPEANKKWVMGWFEESKTAAAMREAKVDELSMSTLRTYHQAAAKSHHMARVTGDNKTMGKRHRGINTAVAKLSKSTDDSIERDGGKMKRPKVYASEQVKAAAKEDTQVDEISQKKITNYIRGASDSRKQKTARMADKRAQGVNLALKKATGKAKVNATEAKVDELSMSLKDLTKTGLNKAATKDKDKIKSDLAKLRARLNKKADGKPVNEISDKMKDRYVQRAVSDYGHSNAVRKDALSRGDKDLAAKMKARMNKRNQGMTRAFGGERD